MDHMLRRKVIATGHHGLAGWFFIGSSVADPFLVHLAAALCTKLHSRSRMDRVVNTSVQGTKQPSIWELAALTIAPT